jgi:hypothetical protein
MITIYLKFGFNFGSKAFARRLVRLGHRANGALLINEGGGGHSTSNPGYEELGCEEGKDQSS